MARTRQKRKAKQRQQQQQQQATRRDATAKQQATNPAEEAAIQTAEALEASDELEEIARGEAPAVEAPPPAPPEEEAAAVERKEPRREPRKEPRRERKPAPEKRKEPRQRGRVATFLVQVWAELRRVQWPDRNQVTQATGVVVVFCFLAGAFLAFWDFVFGELVTSIL
jgi:preprotein translocase SecE subunit